MCLLAVCVCACHSEGVWVGMSVCHGEGVPVMGGERERRLCVACLCRSHVSECGGWVCDRDKLRDKETEGKK